MNILAKPENVVLLMDVATGDKFTLFTKEQKYLKMGSSNVYTKIEPISGDVVDGTLVGQANCTYEKIIGNTKEIRYSWFVQAVTLCCKVEENQN